MKRRQTDLGFLKKLKWNGKHKEFLKKARAVLKAVAKYHRSHTQAEVAKKVGMTQQGLVQLLTELRKAANQGISLEAYVEGGRKFVSSNPERGTHLKKGK